MSNPERERVAAAALGLGSAPSHSAVAWAVAHAVALECGRKPDDAAAIADRWSTVADMAAGSPDDIQVDVGTLVSADYSALEARLMAQLPECTCTMATRATRFYTHEQGCPVSKVDARQTDQDRICPKCGDMDCPIGLCCNRT